MNMQEFKEKVQDVVAEIERLSAVMEDPARIFGEYYERLRPNVIIQFFGMYGVGEGELYDLLITQIRKVPVLSNCRIEKCDETVPASPLIISYKHPEFLLVRMDLKSKRYENVYLSVLRGIDAGIKEADVQRAHAKERVDEIMELDKDLRTLADGDLKLNKPGAWAKKSNIRAYLKRKCFPANDVKQIVSYLDKFLDNCQKEIDVRNAILAEYQQAFAEQSDRKEQFESNPYLQNTISDLVELLKNSGYSEEHIYG